MATTRAAVVRRAVYTTRRGFSSIDGTAALTATGGSATTLIDTGDFPPVGASADLYADQWLIRPDATNAGDRKKLVDDGGYAPATQTVTQQGPNYVSNPTSGTVYLITEDDIDDWNTAFNEALQHNLFRLHFLEFDPTDADRRQYDPTAVPISASWLTERAMIRTIEKRDDAEVANERQWFEYARNRRTWMAYEDQGTLVLDFNRGDPPQTNETIRIIASRPYDTVTADATSVEVEEEWAILTTIWQMAKLVGEPDDPENEWAKILRKHRVMRRLQWKQTRHLGRYAHITVRDEHVGKLGPQVPQRSAR